MRRTIVLAVMLSWVGCGGGEAGVDAGRDAGASEDAGPRDGGPILDDAGRDGGSSEDGSTPDAGVSIDASIPDGGVAHTFPPRDFLCTSGAATPCDTTVPLRSAAERTVVVTADMPRATLTYVVSVLQIPEESGGTAPGFNLDRRDSGPDGSSSSTADCEEYQVDFTSVLEPGHIGVDNVLSILVPTMESLMDPDMCGGSTDGCVDRMIAQSIANGALLLLIEIAGVDSVVNDPDVTVGLYLGEVPGGGSPVLDATGRLAPGQTFATVSPIGVPVRSDIFLGRLRVLPGTITLPMGMAGLPLPGSIARAELRADVALDGLSNGNLGGSTPVSWFVAEAERNEPGIGPTVQSILEAYADIEPTADDPLVCADLSSGLLLSAVPATRTP